ncbi:unknown [Bacteroides clarus CAG:160]|nr:unknown [Bacteroides clarus CAG:160]
MSAGIGTESVYQVLTGFVEVVTAVCHTRNIGYNQTVGPVTVTVLCSVVHGVLHGPQRFHAVFIFRFRTEVVVKIRFQTIAACAHDALVRVFHHLKKVFHINGSYFVGGIVVLTVCFVQICFCQISRSGSTGRASFVLLGNRQVLVGELKVSGYLRPALVVGIDIVGQVVITFLIQRLIIGYDYLLEKLFQQEMSVSAQETHFRDTLLLFRVGGFVHPVQRF